MSECVSGTTGGRQEGGWRRERRGANTVSGNFCTEKTKEETGDGKKRQLTDLIQEDEFICNVGLALGMCPQALHF